MTGKFRAKLFRPEGRGTWTLVPLPGAVVRAAGLKMRQRLRGTIDGAPFASSILSAGGPELFVVVAAPIRERIGKEAGDTVEVRFEIDDRPVVVPVPPDLVAALRKDPVARANFDAFAPSHRKLYVQWVESAVKPETRRKRIEGTVDGARRRRPLK